MVHRSGSLNNVATDQDKPHIADEPLKASTDPTPAKRTSRAKIKPIPCALDSSSNKAKPTAKCAQSKAAGTLKTSKCQRNGLRSSSLDGIPKKDAKKKWAKKAAGRTSLLIERSVSLENVFEQRFKLPENLKCSLPLERLTGILDRLRDCNGALNADAEDGNCEEESVDRALGDDTTKGALCLHCDKTFSSESLKQRHTERMHTPQKDRRASTRKPRKVGRGFLAGCSFCLNSPKLQTVSNDLDALFIHYVDYHSDKYFACKQCTIRFQDELLLDEHNDRVHANFKFAEPLHVELGTGTASDMSTDTSKRRQLKQQTPSTSNMNSINNSSNIFAKDETMLSRLGLTQNRLPRIRKGVRNRRNQAHLDETAATVKTRSKLNDSTVVLGRPPIFSRVEPVSCTFDEDFYETVSKNVRQNLSCHLDGKLESDSFSPMPISPMASVPAIRSTLVRSPINRDTEIHEATSLAAITAFPTLLTASQFGCDGSGSNKRKKPITRHSWKWKWDSVKKYKYVNEGGKIVKKVKHPMQGLRDLSKLDMWTQLTMRTKHVMMQRRDSQSEGCIEELPLGELAREVKRKQLDQLNIMLDTRRLPQISLEQSEQSVIKLETSFSSERHAEAIDFDDKNEDNTILPLCLNLVRNPASQAERSVNLSGEWARPRCYVCVGCGAKFDKVKTLEEHKMFRHPYVSSSHYEIVGRELIEGNLFTHLFIPSKAFNRYREHRLRMLSDKPFNTIGRGPVVSTPCGEEESLDSIHSTPISFSTTGSSDTESKTALTLPTAITATSENDTPQSATSSATCAFSCTKCSRQCHGVLELYRHLLDCSGDYAWILAKKRKYRYFGAKKRRPFNRHQRIHKKKNLAVKDAAESTNEEGTPTKKPANVSGVPRPKPSDAESIRKMLENLPAKRVCKQIIPNATKPNARKIKIVRGKNISNTTLTAISKNIQKIQKRILNESNLKKVNEAVLVVEQEVEDEEELKIEEAQKTEEGQSVGVVKNIGSKTKCLVRKLTDKFKSKKEGRRLEITLRPKRTIRNSAKKTENTKVIKKFSLKKRAVDGAEKGTLKSNFGKLGKKTKRKVAKILNKLKPKNDVVPEEKANSPEICEVSELTIIPETDAPTTVVVDTPIIEVPPAEPKEVSREEPESEVIEEPLTLPLKPPSLLGNNQKSPIGKRRGKKLNDCIAMLTGKLQEKLGMSFLDAPVTNKESQKQPNASKLQPAEVKQPKRKAVAKKLVKPDCVDAVAIAVVKDCPKVLKEADVVKPVENSLIIPPPVVSKEPVLLATSSSLPAVPVPKTPALSSEVAIVLPPKVLEENKNPLKSPAKKVIIESPPIVATPSAFSLPVFHPLQFSMDLPLDLSKKSPIKPVAPNIIDLSRTDTNESFKGSTAALKTFRKNSYKPSNSSPAINEKHILKIPEISNVISEKSKKALQLKKQLEGDVLELKPKPPKPGVIVKTVDQINSEKIPRSELKQKADTTKELETTSKVQEASVEALTENKLESNPVKAANVKLTPVSDNNAPSIDIELTISVTTKLPTVSSPKAKPRQVKKPVDKSPVADRAASVRRSSRRKAAEDNDSTTNETEKSSKDLNVKDLQTVVSEKLPGSGRKDVEEIGSEKISKDLNEQEQRAVVIEKLLDSRRNAGEDNKHTENVSEKNSEDRNVQNKRIVVTEKLPDSQKKDIEDIGSEKISKDLKEQEQTTVVTERPPDIREKTDEDSKNTENATDKSSKNSKLHDQQTVVTEMPPSVRKKAVEDNKPSQKEAIKSSKDRIVQELQTVVTETLPNVPPAQDQTALKTADEGRIAISDSSEESIKKKKKTQSTSLKKQVSFVKKQQKEASLEIENVKNAENTDCLQEEALPRQNIENDVSCIEESKKLAEKTQDIAKPIEIAVVPPKKCQRKLSRVNEKKSTVKEPQNKVIPVKETLTNITPDKETQKSVIPVKANQTNITAVKEVERESEKPQMETKKQIKLENGIKPPEKLKENKQCRKAGKAKDSPRKESTELNAVPVRKEVDDIVASFLTAEEDENIDKLGNGVNCPMRFDESDIPKQTEDKDSIPKEKKRRVKRKSESLDAVDDDESKQKEKPDIEQNENSSSSLAAKKQRKRRKNELAAIVADQLMESFKEVDKTRIDDLKMLKNLAYEKSDDLLLTGVRLIPTSKRKGDGSKEKEEVPKESAAKGKKSTKNPEPTSNGPLKAEENHFQSYRTSSTPSLANRAVELAIALNNETSNSVDFTQASRKPAPAEEDPQKIKSVHKKTKKKLGKKKEKSDENINELQSGLESFTLGQETPAAKVPQGGLFASGLNLQTTDVKTPVVNQSSILRPSILSATLDVTTARAPVRSRDPRLNKNIHTPGTNADDPFDKLKKAATIKQRRKSECPSLLSRPNDEFNTRARLRSSTRRQSITQKPVDLPVEDEDDNYLAEIAKKVNQEIMSSEDKDFNVANDGFELANSYLNREPFERPATSLSMCSAPNLNDDQSNFDENTNTDLIDMDLDDDISVYTSFSQDVSRRNKGRRRRRRSVLMTRKPKKASAATEPNEMFNCDLCSKSFAKVAALTKHRMTLAHVSKVSEQEYLKSTESKKQEEEKISQPAKEPQPVVDPEPSKIPAPTINAKPNVVPAIIAPSPSGIEPISSPEQNYDRYPPNSSSRLTLNPDERLFYECCNILKGSETPLVERSYPVMATSYTYDIPNKSVTPKPSEHFFNVASQPVGSYTDVNATAGSTKPRDAQIPQYPRLDLNQFSDISSDSNAAIAQQPPNYTQSSSTAIYGSKVVSSEYQSNSRQIVKQKSGTESATARIFINQPSQSEHTDGDAQKRTTFTSPLHSASSQGSTITTVTTTRLKTKAAMKGYDNLKVSIPTYGLDMQLALERSPHGGCKLSALADIALGSEAPTAAKETVAASGKDVKSSVTDKFVKNFLEMEKSENKKEIGKASVGAKKKIKPPVIKPTSKPKDVYDFEEESLDEIRPSAAKSETIEPKIVIPDRPFKNIGQDEQQTIKFQKPEVFVPAEESILSTISYSDRDDFNYGSLSEDGEDLNEKVKKPASKDETSNSSSNSSAVTAKTFENKSLIMGRIFKKATKSKPEERAVEPKKAIPKQELDRLFDKLRSANGAEPETEKKPAPPTEKKPAPPAEKKPAKSKPTVKEKSKAAKSKTAIGNSKEISKLQAELGMTPEAIAELLNDGQRKSQRRCAANRPKKMIEMWSSDEYEEFQSTKDIIALIEANEKKIQKKQKGKEVSKRDAPESASNTTDEAAANVSPMKKKKPSVKKKVVEDVFLPPPPAPKPSPKPSPKPVRAQTKSKKVQVKKSTSADKSESESDFENNLSQKARAKITKRRKTISFRSDTKPAESSSKQSKRTSLPLVGKKVNTMSKPMPRRKRVASEMLYYWSSSSSDEEFGRLETTPRDDDDDIPDDGEHYQQHGWIVGDSHKKLVTLLATAKGSKKVVDDCGVKPTKKKS